jgi:hypothetical protein
VWGYDKRRGEKGENVNLKGRERKEKWNGNERGKYVQVRAGNKCKK